jgi:hypothetical protein
MAYLGRPLTRLPAWTQEKTFMDMLARLQKQSLSSLEWSDHEQSLKIYNDEGDEMRTAREAGREEGREEGISIEEERGEHRKCVESARQSLRKGLSIEIMCAVLGVGTDDTAFWNEVNQKRTLINKNDSVSQIFHKTVTFSSKRLVYLRGLLRRCSHDYR